MNPAAMRRFGDVVRGHACRIARSGVVIGALTLASMLVVGQPAMVAAQADSSLPADTTEAIRFTISVDGNDVVSFAELVGVDVETPSSGYWETDERGGGVRRIPGRTKPPTLTLRQALDGSTALWARHEEVRQGLMSAARRSATLTMFNADRQPLARYWLENAWPSRIELAGMQAGANEARITTATFVCEAIWRLPS